MSRPKTQTPTKVFPAVIREDEPLNKCFIIFCFTFEIITIYIFFNLEELSGSLTI